MTSFLTDYILNFVLALIVLVFVGSAIDIARHLYVSYAPISYFYVSESLVVDDVCYGDTKQLVTSTRFVHGTDTGYRSVVNKEMFLIDSDSRTKVYEETTEPFIEFVNNGTVTRFQSIPNDLSTGQYQWMLYPTLTINGVPRPTPVLISNVFSIKDCV